MDPLESTKCPQCQVIYSRSTLHICPHLAPSSQPWPEPQRYAQYGAISFQVVVLQTQHCLHGEQQQRRDLILGGDDGRVVIDLIKTTALVRWVTKTTLPINDNSRYPQTIEIEHAEPRECLIAVIGESRDTVVAGLTAKLNQANRERSDAWSKSVDAGVKSQKAEEALTKAQAETEHIKKHAETTDRALSSAASARDEAHRLVKDMRAELDRIKTKVGTERFDELRGK